MESYIRHKTKLINQWPTFPTLYWLQSNYIVFVLLNTTEFRCHSIEHRELHTVTICYIVYVHSKSCDPSRRSNRMCYAQIKKNLHTIYWLQCALTRSICFPLVSTHTLVADGGEWAPIGLCLVPHIVTRPLRKVKSHPKQNTCLTPSNSCLYTIVRTTLQHSSHITPGISGCPATLATLLTVLAVRSLLIITPISLERNKRV